MPHEVRHADGRITYPMDQDMQGLLLYTADGHVAANLMACKRPRPVSGVMRSLPDEALALLARGYMAYSGPYRVDESACAVYHDFAVCLDLDQAGGQKGLPDSGQPEGSP